MNTLHFFATAPAGIEPLLAAELEEFGGTAIKPLRSGVQFQGTLETAYRACLWSRTASRILLPLAVFPAADSSALYAGIHDLPWEEHLAVDGSLSVEFNGKGPGIDHSHYGAQRVKDALVDRFRARVGQRPSVNREQPDLRIDVQWRDAQVTVSLDLAGQSLHRRGYRQASVVAPLKETLAAALLLKCGWRDLSATGAPLLDPLCGSGTFAIEAAWIAGDHAPGLARQHWGFSGWLGHVPGLWKRLRNEAQERWALGQSRIPPIFASDRDAQAVRATMTNAGCAGVSAYVRISQRAWNEVLAPPGDPGLLMLNVPYGERLGDQQEVAALHQQIGARLKSHFSGWQAGLFTAHAEFGKRMGLRANKIHTFHNGTLECRLLRFQVTAQNFVNRQPNPTITAPIPSIAAPQLGAEDFANRLRKNLRHLGRWAAREGIHCYRLYDADLPEYAVAIDRYEQWLHVQEYAAPSSIDPEKTQARLQQVMAVLPSILEVPAENIFLKVRQQQRGNKQYQKHGQQGRFHEVREGASRFLVNFSDYLDTGLFLDHRITRQRLGALANGRRFLNLFGYTGTATVYAALGGATNTTTVDLSKTYLDWARRNLQLNGLDSPWRRFIHADCRQWLAEARENYDLIFIDPPTFSNSKSMESHFDVQRDHGELLKQALRLLADDGILIFSTNYRRFRLMQDDFSAWHIEDWSRQTLPVDFERHPKIHQCYMLRRC